MSYMIFLIPLFLVGIVVLSFPLIPSSFAYCSFDKETGKYLEPCRGLPVFGPPSLKQQIADGKDMFEIYCPNPEHVLTQRDNGNLACVTLQSAEKLDWQPIWSSKQNDLLIKNNQNLLINDNEYDISYEITNGNISKIWYSHDFESINFNIDSFDNGNIKIQFSNKLFEDRSDAQFVNMMVLMDMEEIHFNNNSDDNFNILNFNFTNTNPNIEIIQVYMP